MQQDESSQVFPFSTTAFEALLQHYGESVNGWNRPKADITTYCRSDDYK